MVSESGHGVVRMVFTGHTEQLPVSEQKSDHFYPTPKVLAVIESDTYSLLIGIKNDYAAIPIPKITQGLVSYPHPRDNAQTKPNYPTPKAIKGIELSISNRMLS